MLHITSNSSEVFGSLHESLNTFLQEAVAEAVAELHQQHLYQQLQHRHHTTAAAEPCIQEPPTMLPVTSSDLHSVGYDGAVRELYIRFHSRVRPYVYLSVPVEVFGSLLSAPSKGKYFHANIKPRYVCRK